MTSDDETPARRVASAVRRYREGQSVPYTELSERLSRVGVPIPVLGLRRIEKGERRVDIDELIALARVLGVPPILLVLPLGKEETVEVLPGEHRSTWAVAKWFGGQSAFPAGDVDVPRDPLVGSEDDNNAWAATAPPVVFHADHDRFVADWSWAAGQVAVLRDLAGRQGVTRAERTERLSRARHAEQQVREIEARLAEHRDNMRRRGIVPPPLVQALTHVDRGDQ